MRLIIVGPGRAGTTLATACTDAGHDLVAVVGKNAEQAANAAEALSTVGVSVGDELPVADLLLICTRDDAIGPVAAAIAPYAADRVTAAVHVSGLSPVSTLQPLADVGLDVGSFHPLQTLPSGDAGARQLPGSWFAVTADDPLRSRLDELATSLDCRTFELPDDAKALYHAAAAAAANFPLVALGMASDLLDAAGVPFDATRPLVEAMVVNAYDIGPLPSLTGPVVRGDIGTVRAQLDAVATHRPHLLEDFLAWVRIIARRAGRTEQIDDMLADWVHPGSSR